MGGFGAERTNSVRSGMLVHLRTMEIRSAFARNLQA